MVRPRSHATLRPLLRVAWGIAFGLAVLRSMLLRVAVRPGPAYERPEPEVQHEGASEDWAVELEHVGEDLARVDLSKGAHARSRYRFDELGKWDPDTADWSEPAIFRELASGAVASGALTINTAAQPTLAELLK